MSLNLFEMFQSVLGEELDYDHYKRAGESTLDPPTHQEAISQLLKNYSVQGLQTADSLDFNRTELRCAYMFLYSTSHAHMVLDALSRYNARLGCAQLVERMRQVENRYGTFNITSVGGGPGSDPLGILVFLRRFGLVRPSLPISVRIVDHYCDWERPFRSLMHRFDSDILRVGFSAQDLLKPLTAEVKAALRVTDFLSVVKFVSAISGDHDGTLQTLAVVFGHLPLGALALVIDNSGGPCFKQTMFVAQSSGLEPVLGPICHINFRVSKNLEPGMALAQFGKRAQTSCNISVTILQKVKAFPLPSEGWWDPSSSSSSSS